MWGPLGVSTASQEGEDFTWVPVRVSTASLDWGPHVRPPGDLHNITGGRGLHVGACEGLYSMAGWSPHVEPLGVSTPSQERGGCTRGIMRVSGTAVTGPWGLALVG